MLAELEGGLPDSHCSQGFCRCWLLGSVRCTANLPAKEAIDYWFCTRRISRHKNAHLLPWAFLAVVLSTDGDYVLVHERETWENPKEYTTCTQFANLDQHCIFGLLRFVGAVGC